MNSKHTRFCGCLAGLATLGGLKCILVAAAWVSAHPIAVAQAKPNVVLIVTDDAGYADFSFQGSKEILTPRIDSIARTGVRFTQAYVPAGVCSPSRMGMLTGRYPHRFGIEYNPPEVVRPEYGLPLAERTLASYLRAGGHRTAALGKWHLGLTPAQHPLSRGFDEFYGFLKGQRSYLPVVRQNAISGMMKNRKLVAEEFDYLTDELGQAAAAFIRDNKERPFFLYVAFNGVHTPMQARPEDLAQVPTGITGKRRELAAMTIALDRSVGYILNALKRNGLTDNTLLFFINDNGGDSANGSNNFPLRGFKGSVWEGGIRVPFLMKWPARLPSNMDYHHPVSGLDILPTTLAATGLRAWKNPVDGVNLLPHILDSSKGPPHEVLYWKRGQDYAVRKGDWKLVFRKGETSAPALFDLRNDISEIKNVAATNPAKVKELRNEYLTWKKIHQPVPWRNVQ